MYSFLKRILFLFSPEKAHYLAMDLLSLGLKLPFIKGIIKSFGNIKNQEKVNFCSIEFPNAIGLAAGFDKNAKWLHILQFLGFGHIEIGTLTPKPQDGNPKPRLFRLPKDEALINRMGFNNDGVNAAVERLKNRPKGLIVGGNIGKNKLTSNENALSDYNYCFEKIYDYVDYIVINVSSPNTPGLRQLQDSQFLKILFSQLHDLRSKKQESKPILLKIAPDLEFEALKEIAELCVSSNIDGLIVSNTTIDRSLLKTDAEIVATIGNGGLSGAVLSDKSTQVLHDIKQMLPLNYPIIGVGGVYSKQTMANKIKAGAQLVQVYTGFIYKGPGIVKQLLH